MAGAKRPPTDLAATRRTPGCESVLRAATGAPIEEVES